MSDTKGDLPETGEPAVAPEAEDPGPSTLQRVRRRVGEASSQVTSKVSELRSSTNGDDSAAGTASTGAAAATRVPAGSATTVIGASGGAPTRRTRKARLRLARLDPWSVFKTALLFAVAGAIIFFIATWVVWGVINASGVFDSVNKAVNDLVSSPGSTSTFRLEDYVNTHRILGLTALIGAIDAVLFTALATLFSFLYNLAASVMGGLEVTLAED